MANQLEVEIGANVDKLKKGLSEAEKALKSFSDQTKAINSKLKKNAIETIKTRKAITDLKASYNSGNTSQSNYGRSMLDLVNKEKKLSAQTKTLRSDLNRLNKSATDLGGKGLKGVGKGAANAVPAVTEFSRIIQDAPFGIQGVANNIQQLTQQFGYLKQKTGSTSTALKAMLTTLTGPAGLLFAVSIITSLWVAYSNSQRGAEKSTNALADSTKDLIGSAKLEINTLNTLLGIAKNESRTRRERQLAIKKIQELYPDYLKNISIEGLNSEDTSKRVDLLTKSLIRQAKVKGLQSRLSDLYAKQYEIENKSLTEQIGTFKAFWILLKNGGNASKAAIDGVSEATKKQKEELSKLDKELKKVNSSISSLVSGPIDFNKIFGGDKEIEASIKVVGVQDLAEPLDKALKETPLQTLPVDWTAIFNAQQLQEQTEQIQQKLTAFTNSVHNIVNGSLVSALSGIGTAIGDALVSGGNVLAVIGETILKGLAGFIGKMGDLLIEYGTLAILKGKLDVAIAVGGPVAIAAGLAAVGVGIALKAASAAIGGFASSGGSSDSAAGGGESRGFSQTQRASSGFSGNGNGTVVFEIAGNKLVGVLSNTLRQNKSLGGGLGFSS